MNQYEITFKKVSIVYFSLEAESLEEAKAIIKKEHCDYPLRFSDEEIISHDLKNIDLLEEDI